MIDPNLLTLYRLARDKKDELVRANEAAAKAHGSSHGSGAFNTPDAVPNAVSRWRALAVEIADAVADDHSEHHVLATKYRCQRCSSTQRMPALPHVLCLECERAVRAEMTEVT